MGIVRGLKNINAHIEHEEAKYSGDSGPKTVWFKIADKQAVKVRFLQELDPDSENYSQKNDLGFLAVEHVNPKNFRRKAICSADEGACYGCEQHAKDWKAGWKQKTRLYINVLVDDGKNEPFVAVLSQGNGPKSITPTLLEYATDDGTITDRWWKVKRSGSQVSDTSYMLLPGSAATENVEDYELFDLNKVVRQVPYEQQEAHYLGGEVEDSDAGADAAREATVSNAGSTGVDSEW